MQGTRVIPRASTSYIRVGFRAHIAHHPPAVRRYRDQAQEFQFVMDSLTKKHCKKLSNQILANNLTPAMYATQWFLTAFTQRFPYDLVTRVWDIFLLEDWKVFYRVCLALFK